MFGERAAGAVRQDLSEGVQAALPGGQDVAEASPVVLAVAAGVGVGGCGKGQGGQRGNTDGEAAKGIAIHSDLIQYEAITHYVNRRRLGAESGKG